MTPQISNKIPLRILIKESGKLFFFFLLGTILIISLQEFSFKNLGVRTLTLGSLFLTLFTLNTALTYFLDQKRKSKTERIWKKNYTIGYLCSLIVFFLHHFMFSWLEQKGLIKIDRGSENFSGFRLIAFIMYGNLVIYTFIFLIQNFILDQYEKGRIQLELLKLKAANAEAVNQLLQQQIQPHFLFNALNILKALIRRDAKVAETYLLKLSDFLRVSISRNKSGVATIKDELKICNDYMEMQSIRFGSNALNYKVDIEKEDPILEKKIPFFSLQPLLENAIKHNELTESNPLYIHISIEGNYIKITNNIQSKSHSEVSTGNGHNMLKERYKILNGEAPKFEAEDNNYIVKLQILNNKNSANQDINALKNDNKCLRIKTR